MSDTIREALLLGRKFIELAEEDLGRDCSKSLAKITASDTSTQPLCGARMADKVQDLADTIMRADREARLEGLAHDAREVMQEAVVSPNAYGVRKKLEEMIARIVREVPRRILSDD